MPRSRKPPERQVKTQYTWPMERYQPPTKGGRLAYSEWTIIGISSGQKEPRLGELTPSHRHQRRPCPRRVVKHQHTHRRRKRQQEQHMEGAVHQWISMQQGQPQSVSNVTNSATSNATALMHLNPGRRPCVDSIITGACIQWLKHRYCQQSKK